MEEYQLLNSYYFLFHVNSKYALKIPILKTLIHGYGFD